MTAVADAEFEALVAPHLPELRAYCYRMLGSMPDAEDALQESLVGAWKGLAGFEGRSSLRSWLYRIATNTCLRMMRGRSRRVLSAEVGPARRPDDDLGEPLDSVSWLEPYTGADVEYEQRESVELAFVAALQHLPPNQRAVLVLREALAFSADDVATYLDTSVASVNSALQRARATVQERVPPRSQQVMLRELGDDAQRRLVQALVAAWHAADVDAIVAMLSRDVRFTMPPLPAWFDGIDDVTGFLRDRVFATPWRIEPVSANGQLAFFCRQQVAGGFRPGALNVLTLDGDRIAAITAFLDPAVLGRF